MKFRSDSVDRLFQTILNLGTIEECYAYFEDLCTIKEVGISTATIGRVSRCLNYGTGGYRTAINRLNGAEES